MEKNIGEIDKVIRSVLGLGIIALGIVGQNWLGIIGLFPLGTAFFAMCPLYTLLGIATCPKSDNL